jgi:hypothetical protein
VRWGFTPRSIEKKQSFGRRGGSVAGAIGVGAGVGADSDVKLMVGVGAGVVTVSASKISGYHIPGHSSNPSTFSAYRKSSTTCAYGSVFLSSKPAMKESL